MAKGKKTGGGSRLGKPNKSKLELRSLIDKVCKGTRGKPLEETVRALYKLSVGSVVVVDQKDLVIDDKGQLKERTKKQRVYLKEPDAFAAKTLLEFRFGKASQHINVDSDGEDGAGVMAFVVPAFNSSVNLPKQSGRKS